MSTATTTDRIRKLMTDTETLYAIVNTDSPHLNSPLVITNETAEPRQSATGSNAAIYHDEDIAKDQLAIQRAAFGEDHLKLVELTVSDVEEDIAPAEDGSSFHQDVGLIAPEKEY